MASGSASSLVGVTAVVDVAARWCRGVLRCRWPPNCALALRGSGGAGFHVRLTPQCRGAVGCGSVCGVAAAGAANAVGGALPCGRRRGCGRSGGSPTPDGKICAPCMIRGVRAAKRAPSWQDLRAVYPPTAICGAFRIHGAHILPKPARFGCMARRSCHEAPLFSSEAPFGIHGVKKLPRIAARERIRAQSCHRQAPGNAFSRAFCHQ